MFLDAWRRDKKGFLTFIDNEPASQSQFPLFFRIKFLNDIVIRLHIKFYNIQNSHCLPPFIVICNLPAKDFQVRSARSHSLFIV